MIILAMYINYTNFSPDESHIFDEGLKEFADKMLIRDGVRLIIVPVRNNSGFINKVECIYPHFVVINKDDIEKMENLDKAVRESLSVDAMIETLMKKIYNSEK